MKKLKRLILFVILAAAALYVYQRGGIGGLSVDGVVRDVTGSVQRVAPQVAPPISPEYRSKRVTPWPPAFP